MKLLKYIPVLRKTKFFRNFSDKDIITLFNENNYKIKDYPKRTIIYLQNQKCKSFDMILKGIVTIKTIDENGKVLTVSEFKTGDTIGGNLLFADCNNYPMMVEAKTETTLLHMDKELVLRFCHTDMNFSNELLRSISNKILIIGTKLKSVTMKTIRQQIIEFLVNQYYIQNTLEIKLNMSKKEWAEKLGVQRPSLSRELSKMKKEGLIDYNRKIIYIKNLDIIKNYLND
ncbi:Crp/Fnr family transcriptional regulator [Caloranaerobacter ferrireducens]|uniref:Crp/Fnr family transcriptional regulator n=1 Tax=Caloranaerobacter ferrireducens TaxID=1323370 RepID=UPI00084D259D|nr:Crp/Fnr family transcriptional regulator [Caloranaerobacter ferrireducens]